MYIHPPTEREKEGAKEERKKREERGKEDREIVIQRELKRKYKTNRKQ